MSAHDPKQMQALMTATAPDLDLGFKPMFGGIMAYAGGAPFASLSNIGLAIKVAGADRETLLAIEGAAPLRYEPDSPPSKSYVVLPPSVTDDAAVLHGWLKRSVAGLTPKRVKAART